MLKQRVVRLVVLGALSVLLVAGCNEDQIERMLGRDAAQSIERTYDVIDDPALSSWVSYVGNTIVAVSTRQHIPYTFKVVDSDMVNAFAAPWGHVYVMRGLTEFAEDEDEVWGVLGHEVAHVVHRDIIKAVKRTLLWSIGASVVASKSRTAGDILGLGLGLLSFHYSRDDEREADDAGVTYAYLAGHDPRGIIAFFDRLQKKYEKNKPTKLEALLSTHPLTSARIARLKERPELNPKNGDALVRIARGYIRRGRALEGLRLAQQAAQVKPEQAEPHLVAAEAALKRGYLSVALTELRRGRELLGYVPAIDRRVNQVASLQPRQWKPWSKEEADQVATLLAQAPQVRTTMQQRQDAVRESQQSLSARVKPLTNRSRALMAELSSLAETDRELTDRLQSALLKGNAVVAQASELVSALETIADGATRITAESNALPALLDRASSLAPCDGPPGTASWLGRSYRAAQTALDDVAEAMSLAGVAVPEAEQALQSSAAAGPSMTRLMA
ncbi:MAG: M48 family metalloprotease, partial [Armatimonadetes bacterium]|nr:M48 family metalloprotease [Armatimonadota bacterium]